METVFFVEGEPQGKDRPRFSRLSGRIYTPRKTEKYEKQIRIAYLDAGGKLVPDDCYVSISVDAYFKIPKSFPKGKKVLCQNNILRPTKMPDVDNILKAVLDGLNKFAYADDKQVVTATCRKYYAAQGNGFLKITVREEKE